jgi:chemotaxis protein MotB
MKNERFLIIFIITSALFLSSCVAPKVYREAVEAKENCNKERDEALKNNEMLTVENTELKSKLETSQQEIKRMQDSYAENADEMVRMKSEYQSLTKRYQDLQATHQALVDGSDAKAKELMAQLQSTQKDLYAREEQLNKERAALDKTSAELEARNKRLSELEKMIAQKDEAVNSLRKKVSDALLGFEGQGLTITKKNGKVYVSLDEKLLFQSGKTEVDAKGVSALKKLAVVLEQNPDINITIEGHTDDVQIIPGSQFKDNWDLSVQRSTAIIRILLGNSKINPKRLTASGRGEFLG